jgi:hypothetical protein
MSGLEEYFGKNRYQGKWQLGDRVFGYWNKIPFIGSVGTDSVVNEHEGARVTVLVDLPIKHNNQLHNVVVVKPADIKPLVDY